MLLRFPVFYSKLHVKKLSTKRSIPTYLLLFLIAFQAISALPVGLSLIINPTGKGIGIPLELLRESPFDNFFIPGLFLFIVLGLFPVLILYGLQTKKYFKTAQKLNLYNNYHWSLSFSYYLGFILILWINMQLLFRIGFHVFHFIYTMVGLLIIFISHLPATKNDFLIIRSSKYDEYHFQKE